MTNKEPKAWGKGYYRHKATNLYKAAIKKNGKRYHLGYFKTEEEAKEAVDRARGRPGIRNAIRNAANHRRMTIPVLIAQVDADIESLQERLRELRYTRAYLENVRIRWAEK